MRIPWPAVARGTPFVVFGLILGHVAPNLSLLESAIYSALLVAAITVSEAFGREKGG